jgi:hypothetical protein
MRAGKGSSDAYIADWRRVQSRDCGDDIAAAATDRSVALEAKYSDDDLLRIIRDKGIDVSAPTKPPRNRHDRHRDQLRHPRSGDRFQPTVRHHRRAHQSHGRKILAAEMARAT